jgi:hypothetical protein
MHIPLCSFAALAGLRTEQTGRLAQPAGLWQNKAVPQQPVFSAHDLP